MTQSQKDVIDKVSDIVLSWKSTNDKFSPSHDELISCELQKLEMDELITYREQQEIEEALRGLLVIIRMSGIKK